jgi:alpha,alpha-trehalase
MRSTLKNLSETCYLAIISGRELSDVRKMVDIGNIYYAGSHGFEIAGPEDFYREKGRAQDMLPVLSRVEEELKSRIKKVTGAWVERKRYSVAVHFREVPSGKVSDVESIVKSTLKNHKDLRLSRGKKIFELQPDVEWDKGHAVLWLMEMLGIRTTQFLPVYIGDDTTDEDVFSILGSDGVGIIVHEDNSKDTFAHYKLSDPEEVRVFLEKLISTVKGDN